MQSQLKDISENPLLNMVLYDGLKYNSQAIPTSTDKLQAAHASSLQIDIRKSIETGKMVSPLFNLDETINVHISIGSMAISSDRKEPCYVLCSDKNVSSGSRGFHSSRERVTQRKKCW